MNNIKAGDRVQWWEIFKNTKETPRMMTGTVVSTHTLHGNPWVGIQGDGEGYLGGTWVRDVAKLTKLDDTALIAAIAALPQDEDEREGTISSLRWACDEADWLACAAQAGALGVEEI